MFHKGVKHLITARKFSQRKIIIRKIPKCPWTEKYLCWESCNSANIPSTVFKPPALFVPALLSDIYQRFSLFFYLCHFQNIVNMFWEIVGRLVEVLMTVYPQGKSLLTNVRWSDSTRRETVAAVCFCQYQYTVLSPLRINSSSFITWQKVTINRLQFILLQSHFFYQFSVCCVWYSFRC